jgi:hypothetical protein
MTVGVAGISSNLLLLVAYFQNPELQSASNLLLVNMGFADLISCLIGPFYMFLNNSDVGVSWTSAYKYLCLITLSSITLVIWSSLFTLLALSIDRMVCIRFPFFHARVVHEPLVKRFIVGLWVTMVGLLSLPVFGLNTWTSGEPCSAFNVLPRSYFVNFFLLASFIVIILVAVLNLVICAVAISKRRVHPHGQPQQEQQSKSEYKLTKMLLIVVGIFYTCWLPYTMVNAISLLGATTILGGKFPRWLLVFVEFTKVPLILNSTLNPVIYAWKSSTFRRAFCKTLGIATTPPLAADSSS